MSQLAAFADMSARQLQRMFAEYVGIGPKWVIRRARIQEAAARAAAEPQDWSALAAELGYADRAHFTRDFTASIGTSRHRTRVRRDAGTTSGRRGMTSFNGYASLNNENLRRNDLREGRPRRRPDMVLGDRGYDHDKYRHIVWDLGVKPLFTRPARQVG
ncbi:helix-turn-helix domain-containing protein [Streptomyces coeruleorubidus]|nr:AraC family transcriptional regulator [Streptomyces coeruleorubidus]GGU02878.1 hypothetical protein GCM10010256_73700 [Streptomyces coeruleorubidus]